MAHDGPDTQEPIDRGEERCAHCGSVVDVAHWHPLVSRVDDDEVSLYAFCDVDCRNIWLDD